MSTINDTSISTIKGQLVLNILNWLRLSIDCLKRWNYNFS